MVRSRGLEPPRVAPLAPQASASTNSATTACGGGAGGPRRARRPTTAQHVTNRMCTDKGGPPSSHLGRARQHLLDFHGDPIAAHHHGALGHREIVGENLDLVVLPRIELNDGAAAKAEHLM